MNILEDSDNRRQIAKFLPEICEGCAEFIRKNGDALRGACNSVGIEHDTDGADLMADYLLGYHQRGHQGIGGQL